LKHFGIRLDEATAAVQGCGNVGGIAARLLHEAGCKVIAISDSQGGIYNPKGLDIPAVLKHKSETGGIVDMFTSFTDAKGLRTNVDVISNAELLELDCTVLLPAANDTTDLIDARGQNGIYASACPRSSI
jgi:glutamate dehydrogenase/leucine dehydrogenase